MVDMCRKFHTYKIACIGGCHDLLRQMQRTGQAAFIEIHVLSQDLKGYHLQLIKVMSLYNGEAGMRIERCGEDCYDLCNPEAAGDPLLHKFSR